MLAEGDPIAVDMYEKFQVIMPNFRLEPHEIEALIDYLDNETQRLRERSVAETDHTGHSHTHGGEHVH